MSQWLQQMVAFSRNFGWLNSRWNSLLLLSSADTTVTVYFNSLQQFCCNAMPFAAGFWQDFANLFLQGQPTIYAHSHCFTLKKKFQARKKENCYLMRKKKLQKHFTLFQPTQTFLSKQRPFLSQRNWIELARTHITHPAYETKRWSFQKDFSKSFHNYPSPY